jgi:hypothetical protein
LLGVEAKELSKKRRKDEKGISIISLAHAEIIRNTSSFVSKRKTTRAKLAHPITPC